jgi:DeoR/GlpR family transcriptional regulator of sugar metabolism
VDAHNRVSLKQQERLRLLKEILLQKAGQPVPLESLADRLNERFYPAVRLDSVRKALYALKRRCASEFLLTVGKDGAVVEQVYATETPIEQRSRFHALEKESLGIAFWDFILGREGETTFRVHNHDDTLVAKVNMLRQKSSLTVALDSGSTTAAVAQALLGNPTVPIVVKTDRGGTRFFRPNIVTTSVVVANAVMRSPHAHTIPLTLVGGSFSSQTGSVTGPLAEMCVASWKMRTDVAVIGCTSFSSSYLGSPAFGCDDIAEARIKAFLLEETRFKVIIFDSSKLLDPEAAHFFAPLSKTTVDLIVTNQAGGHDKLSSPRRDELSYRVENLLADARKAGVSALLVHSRRSLKTHRDLQS